MQIITAVSRKLHYRCSTALEDFELDLIWNYVDEACLLLFVPFPTLVFEMSCKIQQTVAVQDGIGCKSKSRDGLKRYLNTYRFEQQKGMYLDEVNLFTIFVDSFSFVIPILTLVYHGVFQKERNLEKVL